MYGADFINIRQDGFNDGIEVGIDQDSFAQYVSQYITGGTVSSVDGVGPDTNGNVPLGAVKSVNGTIFPDASGNVEIDIGEGTVKTVDNIAVTEGTTNIDLGAVTVTDVADLGSIVSPDGSYEKYACPTAHGHNHDAIEDWDDATDGFVTSVDGKSPTDGAISFGLTASSWMKTDSSGHISTTTESPIAIDTSTYTPVSGTVTVVTSVSWTSPNIVIKGKVLTFENGVLVTVGSEKQISTIATVAYS